MFAKMIRQSIFQFLEVFGVISKGRLQGNMRRQFQRMPAFKSLRKLIFDRGDLFRNIWWSKDRDKV